MHAGDERVARERSDRQRVARALWWNGEQSLTEVHFRVWPAAGRYCKDATLRVLEAMASDGLIVRASGSGFQSTWKLTETGLVLARAQTETRLDNAPRTTHGIVND